MKESEAHRLLHAWSLQPFHRLRSIAADMTFVAEVCLTLNGEEEGKDKDGQLRRRRIPVVGNLRCGAWYVESRGRRQGTVAHFKSMDGHYGQWSFSVRRSNLHFLKLVVENGGAVLVDATRTGKRFPDSLSKTLPIWVCVMNRALAVDGEDMPLVLPTWISAHERNSIEALLPTWVDHFRSVVIAGGVDLPRPTKRLGVIWIHRETSILSDYSHLDFVPIFAVTASRVLDDNERADVDGYYYIPGAADDEENWSLGLSAELFHRHMDFLLNGQAEGCEGRISTVVGNADTNASTNAKEAISPTATMRTTERTDVFAGWETGIAFADDDVLDVDSVWKDFDIVVLLGRSTLPTVGFPPEYFKGKFIYDKLANYRGKYDAKHGLERSLTAVLNSVATTTTTAVLLTAPKGSDAAVGAMIACLCACCESDDKGGYHRTSGWRYGLVKEDVNEALLKLAAVYPWPISPSRTTLKQIHRVFMPKPSSPEL